MPYDPQNPRGHYDLSVKVPESVIAQIRELGMAKAVQKAQEPGASKEFIEGVRRFYPFMTKDFGSDLPTEESSVDQAISSVGNLEGPEPPPASQQRIPGLPEEMSVEEFPLAQPLEAPPPAAIERRTGGTSRDALPPKQREVGMPKGRAESSSVPPPTSAPELGGSLEDFVTEGGGGSSLEEWLLSPQSQQAPVAPAAVERRVGGDTGEYFGTTPSPQGSNEPSRHGLKTNFGEDITDMLRVGVQGASDFGHMIARALDQPTNMVGDAQDAVARFLGLGGPERSKRDHLQNLIGSPGRIPYPQG